MLSAASVVRHDGHGQHQHQGDRPRSGSDAGHRDALRPPPVRHHRPAVPAAGRGRCAALRQLRLAPGRVRAALGRRRGSRAAPGGTRRVLMDRRAHQSGDGSTRCRRQWWTWVGSTNQLGLTFAEIGCVASYLRCCSSWRLWCC